MDIAFESADQDQPRGFSVKLAAEVRLHHFHHPAEDFASYDQTGEEIFATFIALAYFAHALLTILDDLEGIFAALQALAHQIENGSFSDSTIGRLGL